MTAAGPGKARHEAFIPNSFQTPNSYVDLFMSFITPDEFKVLIYIARRIFGFQKRQDYISLSQITNGITARDGSCLDRGTGLSLHSARKAIRGLVAAGLLIQIEGSKPDRTPALYALQLDPDAVNIEFLEKRLSASKTIAQARIEKAREAIGSEQRVNVTEPVDQQVYATEPVQVYATEDDGYTPQKVQKTERKPEENQTTAEADTQSELLLSFSSSFSDKEKFKLSGELSDFIATYFDEKARIHGIEKVNAYLEWCAGQGWSWAKSMNVDKKFSKIEGWQVKSTSNSSSRELPAREPFDVKFSFFDLGWSIEQIIERMRDLGYRPAEIRDSISSALSGTAEFLRYCSDHPGWDRRIGVTEDDLRRAL